MTRILLTGPFKPFSVDNKYSRKESVPELFHNQLTQLQGIYSPRMDFPTYGLHLIGANVPEDITVLDWPTFGQFEKEIRKDYDYVGIGSIAPNLQKVKKMTETIREVSPQTRIMVGGFCATLPDLDRILDVDYICAGEGISFVRDLLGHSREFELMHPDIMTRVVQVVGIPVKMGMPVIVPSLGCSRGCEFCAPTHFFGKRKITFIHTGEQIFDEMERLERKFKVTEFNLGGDDNFLQEPERAGQLRDCLMRSGKPYTYHAFASANLCARFHPRELAEMGISSIWIGRESKFISDSKTQGVDLKELIDNLGQWGISTILSSILLMDCHTRDNIGEDIEDHIRCRPAFSQFSHFSASPGTPLWDRMVAENRIVRFLPIEEWHGFRQPWLFHPDFSLAGAERLQRRAYEQEFLTLGPSLARMIHNIVRGYTSFRQTDSPPLLARARKIEKMLWIYKAALYDMELLADDHRLRSVIRDIRTDVESMVGKLTIFEKTVAAGAWGIGTYRKLHNRVFSDVIQPRTILAHYPADWRQAD